jgi:FkbM family methyltransferase
MPILPELASFVRHAMEHPSPLSNRVRTLARFGYRQAHKRLVGKPLHVRWEGMDLEIPIDAKSASSAYYYGRLDYWEFAFLERFLRPGDCAADVGANVGIYTMFLAKLVGPGGEVVAFEPDPENLERIRANVSRNALGQVRIVAAAAGTTVGTARFLAAQDAVGHLATAADHAPSIEVPLTTMDATFPAGGPVFVKVDVEGFEIDVLRGSSALLARKLPLVWQLEFGSETDPRNDAVAALLRSHGYGFFRYDPAVRGLVACEWRHRLGNNLLAVRDLDQVLARLG